MSRSETPRNTANTAQLLLKRQLADLNKNPLDWFSAGLVDDSNLFEWEILIIGPPDSLYEGAFLKARLSFTSEFPLKPPKLRFLSEMWHPNVYHDGAEKDKGELCISILHDPGEDQYGYESASERWLPVHTVETILISVVSLLSQNTPSTDSPANVDAAVQVRDNLPAYRKKVRQLARRSADEYVC